MFWYTGHNVQTGLSKTVTLSYGLLGRFSYKVEYLSDSLPTYFQKSACSSVEDFSDRRLLIADRLREIFFVPE